MESQDTPDRVENKQGSCSVFFHLNTSNGPYIVKGNNQARVPCDKEFLSELEMMGGVKEVWTY